MYHINKQILDDELGGLFFFLDFQNLNLKVSAVLKQFVIQDFLNLFIINNLNKRNYLTNKIDVKSASLKSFRYKTWYY